MIDTIECNYVEYQFIKVYPCPAARHLCTNFKYFEFPEYTILILLCFNNDPLVSN